MYFDVPTCRVATLDIGIGTLYNRDPELPSRSGPEPTLPIPNLILSDPETSGISESLPNWDLEFENIELWFEKKVLQVMIPV